jgi:hypothetical protein
LVVGEQPLPMSIHVQPMFQSSRAYRTAGSRRSTIPTCRSGFRLLYASLGSFRLIQEHCPPLGTTMEHIGISALCRLGRQRRSGRVANLAISFTSKELMGYRWDAIFRDQVVHRVVYSKRPLSHNCLYSLSTGQLLFQQ